MMREEKERENLVCNSFVFFGGGGGRGRKLGSWYTYSLFGYRLFCWKLKIYYWKYYNKIFFLKQKHCLRIFSGVGWSMNSAMRPTKKNANA